jgi:hypothetical protein
LLIFLQKKHVSRKENRTGILRHGVYDEKATFQLKSQLFRTEKVAFSLFSHPYFLLEFGLRDLTFKDDFSDGSHNFCCFCESGAAWAVERVAGAIGLTFTTQPEISSIHINNSSVTQKHTQTHTHQHKPNCACTCTIFTPKKYVN